MKIADVDILILPDLGGASAEHWQRRWGSRLSSARVVEQAEWNRPKRAVWISTIGREIMMATRPVVLIAHGLGVSATVHAASHLADAKVRGAFLVAPPDHESGQLAREFVSFNRVPRDPLPFPSMLIASSDDAACSVERAVDMATCWGSDLHIAGAVGHLDTASGHGPWPEGLMMFTRLMQRLN